MAKILIIDDEPVLRALVGDVAKRLGLDVLQASSFAEGLACGQVGVDIVVLDKMLPDCDGLTRIKDIVGLPNNPSVIVITGHGDGDAAEAALRSGAWEFLTKPFGVQKIFQVLKQTITYRANRLQTNRNLELERADILGTSSALNEACQCLQDAAASDVNVLLLGETGVGKELFAKTLYHNSLRAGGPFVAVDCAALPETLVESHLFGHVRGAFTGAERAKDGLLLAAHKGTLFLDEVGELPLSMQKAFLRALEVRSFRPVGSVEEVASDFRLVAATNKDLPKLVDEGLFRKDLLYRLQGMTIRIPPLRDRREDIATLAAHAVHKYCKKYNMPIKAMEAHFIESLHAYAWPGNVRELMHSIERACVAAKGEDELFTIHLPTDMRVSIARNGQEGKQNSNTLKVESEYMAFGDDILPLKEWKSRAEYGYIQQVLVQGGGDIRKCAAIAGISRGHFYELLKKHGLSVS